MEYNDFATLDEYQKCKMKRKTIKEIILYVVIAIAGVSFLAIKINTPISVLLMFALGCYGVCKEYRHRNLWEKAFRQNFPGQDYGKYFFLAIPHKTGIEELDFLFFVKRGWFIGIGIMLILCTIILCIIDMTEIS